MIMIFDLHHQQHQQHQQHGRKTINSYDPNSFRNKTQKKNIRRINPKAGSFHKGRKKQVYTINVLSI